MGVLYARVGGAWVPIPNGAEEVYIGSTDPGPTYELWYNDSATSPTGGAGIPAGGSQGMMLVKQSATDYDATWQAPYSAPILGRNLIDNGQYMVRQRTNVASIALSGSATFLSDRWAFYNNGVGVANVAVSPLTAFGVSPPAGRPRPANMQYFQISTAEAAGAIAAADYMQMAQGIEGLNLQHLGWGTADAKNVMLTFDCYSTVAATYVAELFRNDTSQRTISRSYSVPAGFSTVSLSFPGDTTMLTSNDTLGRLLVVFWVAAGTNYTSTALQTSWGPVTNTGRATGVTNNLPGSTSNVFGVTNVQLEPGTVATPYEVRSYADELLRCRRCLQRFDSTGAVYTRFGQGVANSATGAWIFIPLSPPMRAVPTLLGTAANTFLLANGVIANTAVTALTLDTNGTSVNGLAFTATVASGLTSGQPIQLCSNNQTTTTLDVLAEI